MKAHKLLLTIATLVAAGCSTDTMQLSERTVTMIGPTGGQALSADGRLTLTFEPGALRAAQEITIETVRNAKSPRLRSLVYELGPDGIVFGASVRVAVAATPTAGEELAIANVDGAYPDVMADSAYNAESGLVTATLPHFSGWAVVSVYNPCAGLSCGDACTVCDPLDPMCTEPAPSPKACNRSGLCVEAAIVTSCGPSTDAGVAPDATPADAQTIPDAGSVADGAVTDAGIVDAGGPPDGGPGTCVETFVQNPQPIVDILIVMDDSCSMSEEQATLASSFDLLLTTLQNNNVDFHIGVTTTDVDASGPQGALIGTPTYLEPSTPNLAMAFASHVLPGTNGSGVERGLEASRLALSPPLSTGANAGFLRSNSALALIYVSDEPDGSPMAPAAYVTFLETLRDARRLQANAIVGDVMGCSGGMGSASVGTGYLDVQAATGGAFSSICTPPWSQALTDLGGPGFGFVYEFTLSAPATHVVEVWVDGVAVPATDAGGNVNWTFDPVTGAVSFSETSVPAPDAIIEVMSGC